MRAMGVAWAIVFMGAATVQADATWPQFRGPEGQGHARGVGLPIKFSETENVVWKTPLPGQGWSSPVSDGQVLWMTTALDAAPGQSLRALCVDVATGKLLRDVEVFHASQALTLNNKNSHASPTPVLDGDRLYVHFGSYGTACLNSKTGQVVWRDTEQHCDHKEGPGSSPVLYENLLIVHFDGMDVQYVVAFDKDSGRVAWKTDRSGKIAENPEQRKAYGTPLVVPVGGRDVLVSPGAFHVWGYDPRTGRELWNITTEPGFSTVPRPVFGNGLVYLSTGYMRPALWAIRPNGHGNVTDSHVVWKFPKQAPANPSPLLVGEQLYMFADKGVATCLDARKGEEIWTQRIGGNFSSSPLLADGRIYIGSEEGLVHVLQPGREYKSLAINELDGRIMASPAVLGHALYLRTDKALYRFEKKGK